jgi:hypothetical protein
MKLQPEHKSMLCVGGPEAGRRYHAARGSGFRVAVRGPLPPLNLSEAVAAEVSHEIVSYRAEYFHTPQGDVTFWVPEGQTPLETMTILLECYERAGRVDG